MFLNNSVDVALAKTLNHFEIKENKELFSFVLLKSLLIEEKAGDFKTEMIFKAKEYFKRQL